jgi:8-oxo-dGTP diphosphatase
VTGHCFRCGGAFPQAPPTVCAECGYEQYLPARPTASLIVSDGQGRILLLRRSREPALGMWETPGGFCDAWEHPVETALRESREELGVEVVLGPFIGMYTGKYAYQGEIFPVLDCFWRATLPPGAEVTLDAKESSESAWFPIDDLPPLAFSTMTQAVHDARCQKAD